MGEEHRTEAAKFADKRGHWLNMLWANDPNSIVQQLARLALDAVAFRTINEARRLAPKSAQGNPQINPLLHGLLNRTFANSQKTAIRCLVDRGKGTWSVMRLLEDMKRHSELFTRQAMLAAPGLPYQSETVSDSVAVDEGDLEDAEQRHRQIDRLVCVVPPNRRPGDFVPKRLFQKLEKRVSEPCAKVVQDANAFVAHAYAPGSRARSAASFPEITLGLVWEATKNLYQVTSFVSCQVLGDSALAPLPIGHYDRFMYLDAPLAQKSDLSCLQGAWRRYEVECDSWASWTP